MADQLIMNRRYEHRPDYPNSGPRMPVLDQNRPLTRPLTRSVLAEVMYSKEQGTVGGISH